jgi:drug/metabolite transporter (DMT)-like permease
LLVGVACGLAGAVLIVWGRQGLSLPSAANWLLLSLLVPVSLASGNVYRTAFWPQGASPTQLAAFSNILAAPVLLLGSWWRNGGLDFSPFLTHPLLALLQCMVSTIMFSLFFRLQWIGGPTYLSQIGYVAAAVSFTIGVTFLGESYPFAVWAGAGLIIAGIAVGAIIPSKAKEGH